MPAVQTPYLIAALRERESDFLGADEYTRLIEAASPQQALEVLVDTSYGQWLHAHPSAGQVLAALTEYLAATRRWLADQLDKPAVIHFIAARYDSLNLATALSAWRKENKQAGELSPLGAIDHSVVHSVIWNNLGWEYIPHEWQTFVRQERERSVDTQEPTWHAHLLVRVEQATAAVMRQLAFTPLMRELTALYEDHWQVDTVLRRSPTIVSSAAASWKGITSTDSAAAVVKKLGWLGYKHFTEESINNLRENHSATLYDKAWDNETIARCRAHRFESLGYDPIIAYWLGKELEAKTLRLLIMTKTNHVPPETLHDLQRDMYVTNV